jgi:hypothetical protein
MSRMRARFVIAHSAPWSFAAKLVMSGCQIMIWQLRALWHATGWRLERGRSAESHDQP